jgi:hypothetical protein
LWREVDKNFQNGLWNGVASSPPARRKYIFERMVVTVALSANILQSLETLTFRDNVSEKLKNPSISEFMAWIP